MHKSIAYDGHCLRRVRTTPSERNTLSKIATDCHEPLLAPTRFLLDNSRLPELPSNSSRGHGFTNALGGHHPSPVPCLRRHLSVKVRNASVITLNRWGWHSPRHKSVTQPASQYITDLLPHTTCPIPRAHKHKCNSTHGG